MTNRKQTFYNLLEKGNGIQHILDSAAYALGNPLIMNDITYKLIAHTQTHVTDDPLWNELLSLGTFSHQTVDFFINEKFVDAYNSQPIALLSHPKFKYDRINAVIFSDEGIQLGNICVVACHKPFEKDDYNLIATVCEKLAEELEKNKNIEIPNLFEDSILDDLIEGRNPHPDSLRKIYPTPKAFNYVAVVDVIQYENTLTHLLYFKKMFKSIKKDYSCFIYLNNIIILFGTDSPVLNVEDEMKELNELFSKYNIFAGVSSSFSDISQLRDNFRNALNALNYGLCLHSGRHIFPFDIFRTELFLNSHVDDFDILNLCHPILFSILRDDIKDNSCQLDTLYNFFLSGLPQNPQSVAAIQPIAQKYKIDLSDGNILFAIFRSIKLYKCFPEKFSSTI